MLGEGANYTLIGATTSHRNNHYATNATIQTMVAIANEWRRQFPRELPLQINDMSLIFGGKFDVDSSWNGAHQTHRNGRNADLRVDKVNPGIPLARVNGRLVVDRRTGRFIGNSDFEIICNENNVRCDIHSPNLNNEHYHLGF